MTEVKWNYIETSSAIADTGDYNSGVEFTNGKDTLYTNGEDLETDDCKRFCELLDMMPDLWSSKFDAIDFENNQLKKEISFILSERDKFAMEFAEWTQKSDWTYYVSDMIWIKNQDWFNGKETTELLYLFKQSKLQGDNSKK